MPVKVNFRRHAEKTKSTKTLTIKGKKDAKILGQSLPKKPTKFYYDVLRNEETARLMQEGLNSKKPYALRQRNILEGHHSFSGSQKISFLLLSFAKKCGITEKKLIKLWLDNKIPRNLIPNPRKVADDIIRDRFKLFLKVNEGLGKKEIVFENLTHDVVMSAIIQRLTCLKYTRMFGELPGDLESVTISISKGGIAKLKFREQEFDVTEKLNLILEYKA